MAQSEDDRVAWTAGRLLVALGYLGIAAFPLAVWPFDVHYGSPEWHIHARYHILWKGMLFTALGLGGVLLVVRAWQPSLARTIARWVPVVVWAAHPLAGAFMRATLGENPFPHHPPFVGPFSVAELAVMGALLVAALAAGLDGRDARS